MIMTVKVNNYKNYVLLHGHYIGHIAIKIRDEEDKY
jgi:hypothetical protein